MKQSDYLTGEVSLFDYLDHLLHGNDMEETKEYLEKVQAAFPRLKLFQIKEGSGYLITGKFGVLPEKETDKKTS